VKYYTNKARQAGMTLIELTVVLLVLVGLAGLLIPYVSGFVTKTHDSTGASNIQALNNAMQRYAVEHYDNFPDKMDSLLQADNTMFPKMMDEMMPMGGTSYFTETILDSAKANALKNAGVNNVMVMNDGSSDATFANTTGATVSIASGVTVAEITGMPLNDLSHRMGKPTDTTLYHYFAFGIGDDSTIAGATVSDVPVHFSRNGDMGANNAYNHFVAIFEVLKGGACSATGWVVAQSDDVPAGATGVTYDATTFVAAPDITGGTTEILCDAIPRTETLTWAGTSAAPASLPISGSVTYTDDNVGWLNANKDVAKFMGATMAMGMGNLEGLGGSMTRYYENSATN